MTKPIAKKRGKHKPIAEKFGDKYLRDALVGAGIPHIDEIRNELDDYTDILMGREEPDHHYGYMSLMEVADAYFSRAQELTMLIQRAEADGVVTKSSPYYKLRTGELRTFTEMAKRAADLGSRRLSAAQLEFDQATYGRESGG